MNCKLANADLRIRIKVTARAARNELQGMLDGVLRVRTTALQADGAANQNVIRQLANAFGVAKFSVEIVRGKSSRSKQVLINKPSKLPECLRDERRSSGQ